MKPRYELLVVILNYRTARMLIECLNSLADQLTKEYGVVIVDNNSGDGSLGVISNWIAEYNGANVHLVESFENAGFSGGNNLGIQFAEADYFLLLNSDTIVRPGALSQMLQTARGNADAGLISPRLEWPDGKPQISCFKYHSPVSEFINSASTGVFTRILQKWNVPVPVVDGFSFPKWTSFACVLIKAEVFKDIGLMDDVYFLYYEDVDFCRMARSAGWKIINDPKSRVVHLRGGSSDVKSNTKNKKRLPNYVYQSRSRYFSKHYGQLGLLAANLLWLLGRSVSFARELLGKKDCAAVEKQHIDIWIGFTAPNKRFRPKD